MIIKFYIKEKDYNDATNYYISILEKIFEEKYRIKRVMNLQEIKSGDIVFVVTTLDAIKLFFKRKIKMITWFQGVLPEESKLRNSKKKLLGIRIKILNLIEYLCLKKSKINIFVSNEMREHYKKKYSYVKENYFIMPCFNSALVKESFNNLNKKDKNIFVYAGGLSEWQCINETIELYKKIENDLPNTKLKILTAEKKLANKLLKEKGVKNFEIKYVPFNKINEELSECKYGFLLRKKSIINKVATPTKLNTYLANGVIPILTSEIANIEILNNYQNIIILENLKNIERLKKEVKIVSRSNLLEEYQKIFFDYYNEEYYSKKFRETLEKNGF